MTGFEEYLGELAKDREIKRLIDKLLEDEVSGDCAVGVLADHYLYYLFTRRIPRERLLKDLGKCLGAR